MSERLSKTSTSELQEELKRRRIAGDQEAMSREERRTDKLKNLSPAGAWKVTTEGDVEGKTTRNLGIYEGHIADIAFALADQCYYSLEFDPVDPDEVPNMNPKKDSVSIKLPIETGTWDYHGETRVIEVRRILGKASASQEFAVIQGQYHGSVILKLKKD